MFCFITCIVISALTNIATIVLYATVVKDEIGFELKHLYIGWGLVLVAVGLLLVGGLMALILARMVGNKEEESANDVKAID